MLHDKKMLDSLEPFIAKHLNDNRPHDELFNEWVRENGHEIHDADTVIMYIRLFPVIERGLKLC